jgi:uncharacterized protein with WD repeat
MAQIQKASDTWRAVKKHIQSQIEAHQKALEDPHLDYSKTQVLRGRIAELRTLEALPTRTKKGDAAPDVDYSA